MGNRKQPTEILQWFTIINQQLSTVQYQTMKYHGYSGWKLSLSVCHDCPAVDPVLYVCPQLQSDSIMVTFVFKPKQPTNSDARLHCSQSQEFPGTKITWRLVVAKGPSLAAWLLDGFHGKIRGDGGLMRIVSPWLRKPPSLTSTFKLYEFTNHLGVLSEGLMV